MDVRQRGSRGDIKYDEKGLVPGIVQDADSGEILMMAWLNEEPLVTDTLRSW